MPSHVDRPPSSGRGRRPLAIHWLAYGALLGVAGVLVRAEAQRPGAPPGVVAYTDVVYRRAEGRRAKLDVYVPSGPRPAGGRPALVAIHGGGWSGGSKGGFGRDVARLARHGYVVVSVGYRLARPGEPSWPGSFEDVRDAVRWVRRHADDYGIDPDRLVAFGASAGGHLAALLGAYPDGPVAAEGPPSGPPGATGGTSARVQAVVDLFGPADLGRMYVESRAGAGPIATFLGGPPSRRPGRYAAASPARHVTADDPPMLLIHGRLDRTVPPDQSVLLADALGDAGVPHRLIVVEGVGHNFGFRPVGRDLLPDILAFLDEVWNHKGEPLSSPVPGRPWTPPPAAGPLARTGPGSRLGP